LRDSITWGLIIRLLGRYWCKARFISVGIASIACPARAIFSSPAIFKREALALQLSLLTVFTDRKTAAFIFQLVNAPEAILTKFGIVDYRSGTLPAHDNFGRGSAR